MTQEDDLKVRAAIQLACQHSFGVLDSNFLCQSLSILDPRAPVCVKPTDSTDSVLNTLKVKNIGCVLVVDEGDSILGIFTERDCVIKVFGSNKDLVATPVSEFMTPNPVAQRPDCTIAYALNLMSVGGFRHLPIVDEDDTPVGVVSVKDVVDFIVRSYTDALLNFPTTGESIPSGEGSV